MTGRILKMHEILVVWLPLVNGHIIFYHNMWIWNFTPKFEHENVSTVWVPQLLRPNNGLPIKRVCIKKGEYHSVFVKYYNWTVCIVIGPPKNRDGRKIPINNKYKIKLRQCQLIPIQMWLKNWWTSHFSLFDIPLLQDLTPSHAICAQFENRMAGKEILMETTYNCENEFLFCGIESIHSEGTNKLW